MHKGKMIEMGLKCKSCGGDNGITQYYGKTCKYCGKVIIPKLKEEE